MFSLLTKICDSLGINISFLNKVNSPSSDKLLKNKNGDNNIASRDIIKIENATFSSNYQKQSHIDKNRLNIDSSGNTEKTINVLFIDDDTRFKIVDIIKKKTWVKCSIIKDIKDLDEPLLVNSNIIFVDIEDVGKILTPKDQGLGLVVEIKRLYPNKKVIIYSSRVERDMTHEAFKLADGALGKDAQPSQFLRYIEDIRNI